MQIKVEKERALSGSEYTLCHLIAIYLGSVMLICPTSHFLIQAIYTSKWFFFILLFFWGWEGVGGEFNPGRNLREFLLFYHLS